jgi:alkaline phosphatase
MKVLFLIAFLSVSLLFSQEKPKNIIFLIGDGMGISQMTLAHIEKKSKLAVERVKYIGFHNSASADARVTDSAAGATAFSTGQKTYNGAVGVDTNKKSLPTILELAEKEGFSTGLVATASITHATPASFIAHQESREMHEEIAQDFLKTDIDVVIGGGMKYFLQIVEGESIANILKKKGYGFYKKFAQVKESDEKFYLLPVEKHFKPVVEDEDGNPGRDENYLMNATKLTLEKLSKNKKGFFTMIESSQIDWGGHAASWKYVKNEILEFDKVINYVFDFADKNPGTLVVITGDHETGGLLIQEKEYTFASDKYINGSQKHTGVMLPVYAYGTGAEDFGGIYENTEIFHKFKKYLGIK